MPTFTPPTYDQPVDNVLGKWGISFPVSYAVVINASDEVTPYPGATGLADPDQLSAVAKAGSGDGGYAIFRQGRTYTITTEEKDLLEGAGYDVS